MLVSIQELSKIILSLLIIQNLKEKAIVCKQLQLIFEASIIIFKKIFISSIN